MMSKNYFSFVALLFLVLSNNARAQLIQRQSFILNGTWQFLPDTSTTKPAIALKGDWGTIRVPGAWATSGTWWMDVPQEIKKGSTSIWHQLESANRAWYKKQVHIPVNWKGGIVELELERVSTDAVVFINGKIAGNIEWYAGRTDVTRYLKYGKSNEIQILVIAAPEAGEVAQLMGTAEAQVGFSKTSLATKGITGNVMLHCRPSGLHVNDVFVKTSYRKNTISALVELAGDLPAGKVVMENQIINHEGKVIKQFADTLIIKTAVADTTVEVAAYWPGAELWDLDSPILYTLSTSLYCEGKKRDTYRQSFGFREFWIDGKFFYLNGKRINLRPTLNPSGSGMHELIEASLSGMRKAGYNFAELWPSDYDIRGDIRDWHEVMEVADRKGFLLSGVVLPFTFYLVDRAYSFTWNNEGVQQRWQKRMLYELKKQRNHPSIIIWGTSPNFFGHPQDQNPLHIGLVGWIKQNEFWLRNAKAANEAIAMVKNADPTRPVFTHHGAYTGDVHTLNFYLSMTPLQEREDWLSHYSRFGQIPFMGIEFGTPLHCTFLRGRNGYGNNIQTEPLVTEFVSMYMGPQAYTKETAEYRSLIRNNFLGKQRYKSWNNPVQMERMPAFQDLQYLFSKNTWRSWRTWEIPGGMVPWHGGHGWIPDTSATQRVKMPPFESNRKGNYFAEVSKRDLYYLQPGGWKEMPNGKAIRENNTEVLAYIAGEEHNFTAKDHHFQSGEWVSKHFYFFNDTRSQQPFTWTASVLLDGQKLLRQTGSGTIAVGEKQGRAFRFQLPAVQGKWKADGSIVLHAYIQGRQLSDTFHFRSFKHQGKVTAQSITVFDPQGKTKAMFQNLGFTVIEWDGTHKAPFLIIGRNALLPMYQMPGNLQAYISKGGKVLLMNQQPDSVAAKKGFRVSKFISRYVFPIDTMHLLFKGLDEKDFRNWTGESRLTEAYPDYVHRFIKTGSYGIPYYGWHWGNGGAVATGALEKPHRSGWRPLMECEFDMAYSPLMELSYSNGHLVWSNLDLEDHYEKDVVAAIMAGRLVQYIDTIQPLVCSRETMLWGNDANAALLTQLGVLYVHNRPLGNQTDLLIVGNINTAQQQQVAAFAAKGGKVLVLPRKQPGEFLRVTYITDTAFEGGYHLPLWPEAAGLSISDTRYRTPRSTVLIGNGVNKLGLDGLLGKQEIGTGVIVYTQFDPDRFEADSLTYFRFTRWRQTRALTQVLANMGATFEMDRAFFENLSIRHEVALDGQWKAIMTNPVQGAKDVGDKHKDPGISPAALRFMQPDANESGMISIVAGEAFERANPDWGDKDGEIVYRKAFEVPAELMGKVLQLELGIIDDYDAVYINGILVGQTGFESEPVWSLNRTYKVPAGVVKRGKNVIAIRIWDTYGGGGLMPGTKHRHLTSFGQNKMGLYHPDYIDDFEMGDDPFRYFRW